MGMAAKVVSSGYLLSATSSTRAAYWAVRMSCHRIWAPVTGSKTATPSSRSKAMKPSTPATTHQTICLESGWASGPLAGHS